MGPALTQHSNISKYEKGTLDPSPAVLLHLLELAQGEERDVILGALDASSGRLPDTAELRYAPSFEAIARAMDESIDNVIALTKKPIREIRKDPIAAHDLAAIMKMWQLQRGDPGFVEKMTRARRVLGEDLPFPAADTEFIAVMRGGLKRSHRKRSLRPRSATRTRSLR